MWQFEWRVTSLTEVSFKINVVPWRKNFSENHTENHKISSQNRQKNRQKPLKLSVSKNYSVGFCRFGKTDRMSTKTDKNRQRGVVGLHPSARAQRLAKLGLYRDKNESRRLLLHAKTVSNSYDTSWLWQLLRCRHYFELFHGQDEHSWNCQNGSEFQSTSSSRIFCRQFGKIARCLVRKSVNSSCEILPEKWTFCRTYQTLPWQKTSRWWR